MHPNKSVQGILVTGPTQSPRGPSEGIDGSVKWQRTAIITMVWWVSKTFVMRYYWVFEQRNLGVGTFVVGVLHLHLSSGQIHYSSF